MKLSRSVLSEMWVKWAAPLMLAAFCAIAIFLNFRRYAAYRTNLYDLGSYSQVIWNVSRGAGFTTSLGPTQYLTNHFSPLMGLIAPLYWVWPDARVLMVVQTVLMAVSIVPGYLILRKRYPRLAPLLVLAFVLSPLVQQTVLEEFHGILLVPPLLAWAFYALYTRRTWWMLFFLALTLFVREDMGIYIAAFGAYLLLFRSKQRLLGLGLIGFGGAAVVVIINVIMPSFGTAYHHFVAFSALGSSTSEIATNALKDPLRVIASIVTPAKLRAFVRFIAPLAGLPILAVTYVPLWLPGVLVYMVSNATGTGLLNTWRVASLIPLIWVRNGGLAGGTQRALDASWRGWSDGGDLDRLFHVKSVSGRRAVQPGPV